MKPYTKDAQGHNDPRLARCSQFARDILERIQKIYSLEDLLADDWRVPAAPAQLRQTCFSSDDTTLDPHIGRALHELELFRIVILRRQSRRIRSLRLCLDFTSAPVAPQVIHNARDGPNEREAKIIAVAAATNSSSSSSREKELIAAMAEYFPLHDVPGQYEKYYAHRKKLDRDPIATGFAKWMLRAEVPLKKLKSEARSQKSEPTSDIRHPISDSQPDLFEPNVGRLSLREETLRLLRKTQ